MINDLIMLLYIKYVSYLIVYYSYFVRVDYIVNSRIVELHHIDFSNLVYNDV